MTAATHDKLIGRLPVEERQKILDAIARATSHGSTVQVEHSYWRKLDGDQNRTVCTIVGVAYAPGGGSDLVLVVRPVDPTKRLLAIPAAHVLRVRWAHDPSGMVGSDPSVYNLGEILAGPPLQRGIGSVLIDGSKS